MLISDPARFDRVDAIGVDEHVWRHTRRGDKYCTVIIDLTAVRAGTGPARFVGHGPGPHETGVRQLAGRPAAGGRDWVQVVAMDGFAGFKTAATEQLPDAVTVLDPFHVVRLADEALDQCRRRLQQKLHGHRGRRGDPLFSAQRTLHTDADLLTEKQWARLRALFANDEHAEVEVSWAIYQRMIAAYRHTDRKHGHDLLRSLINSLFGAVPTALVEIRRLGGTLKRRAADILAFFARPGTSNGPTEAINGALNTCAAPPWASET